MGLQVAREIAALPDVPLDWVTFTFGGTDRIDVEAIGEDVRVELRPPVGGWRSSDPTHVESGTLESIAGLATAYRPRGVIAFRLCNWTPGQPAGVRLRAWGV